MYSGSYKNGLGDSQVGDSGTYFTSDVFANMPLTSPSGILATSPDLTYLAQLGKGGGISSSNVMGFLQSYGGLITIGLLVLILLKRR